MSYNVITVPRFEKELKRLAKKYPSLKGEFGELIQSLKHNPEQGTPLGNHCFKIRLSIASKGKGKSGGARVITHPYSGKPRYIFFPFLTSPKRIPLAIRNFRN
jgi:mRNA-degrading endonuclease RelE of RelBE toxin-antitoxin system